MKYYLTFIGEQVPDGIEECLANTSVTFDINYSNDKFTLSIKWERFYDIPNCFYIIEDTYSPSAIFFHTQKLIKELKIRFPDIKYTLTQDVMLQQALEFRF